MHKFNETATDDEILETVADWVKESSTYHDVLVRAYNKGLQYHAGNQTDLDDIPDHQSDTVYNRIFEAVETLVPIITGSPHEFLAVGDDEDNKSKERANKLQKALTKTFKDEEVRDKLSSVARSFMLGRFGVLEWGWDYDKDDVSIWYDDPRTVLVPKLRNKAKDSPYIIKLQEYTSSEFESFFPDEDAEEYVGKQTVVGDLKGKDNVQVLVTWTTSYVTYTTDSEVLKRMSSPYFDFKGEEDVEIGTKDNKIVKKVYKKTNNYLRQPVMPFVFFAPFRTGETPFAPASLTEIVIPIQDDINTQKRQITNNLVKMGNGQIFMDSDVMDEEKEQSITNEPGLLITGNNIASENRIKREAAVPLPQSHFANLQDSLTAFDNVFGVSSAIRGASDSKTLGGQILNRQQSLSRIDQMSTVINEGVAELAQGVVQLYKMFYTKKHFIRSIGEEGKAEKVDFSKNDVEDGVLVEVTSGTPIALDPQGKFNQAIQMWQLQAIDPETFYERLEFPNPQLSSQKLAAWKAGQLVLEAQISGQAEAQKAERDVETPNDATERATEATTSGGKAPLKNTPNQ